MLQSITELYGNKLNASDGDIGKIEDFYFDDQFWNIRYLMAETGTWLDERQVLISPFSIERLDLEDEVLVVSLTKKQIEESPLIETHRPVSRQFETEYYTYYGWPYYWSGDAILGLGGNPVVYAISEEQRKVNEERHLRDDTHLRSTLAIAGYEIEASDGVIGRVVDFLVNDETWAIQEIVVEAGHWYSGKEVLIPINKVKSISFDESKIHVYLTKEGIEKTGEHHIVHAHAH
jgi:uncharacterized protein YrrD